MKTIVAVILGLGLMPGCHFNFNFNSIPGSGNRKSEVRQVAQFRTLQIRGAADVRGHVGQKQNLTVEIDDNLLDIITTEVDEDTLSISSSESYSSRKGLKVEINVEQLDRVIVQGSGDINLDGLHGDSFEVEVNGSSDVIATGDVKNLKITIRGSGDVDLTKVKALSVEVSIAGSGDVQVHASESLNVTIRGSGDVRYSGNPTLRKRILGSGDVRHID